MFLRFQKFSCAFLAFSLTANAREFKETLVFQYSPLDELLENIVSSRVRRNFLVLSGRVSSGEFEKTLVSWRSPFSYGWKIARIRTYFLTFSCISWDGLFGCFSVPSASIVRLLPFPVRAAKTKVIFDLFKIV